MAIPKNWTSITTSTVTHMNKIESQKNSKHWNAPFHPMKRTIPFYETHSFILWNAPFQCLKLYGCQYLTNHALIIDKRIASKFGVGKFNNVYGISGNNVTAGQKDYAARMMQIEKQREEYYKSLGTPPGVPTMKGATADPDKTGYIQNVGIHYLAKSDKSQFNLTVSNTGGNIPQDAVFSNDAGTSNYDIYLTNGYVNHSLGNCYDFECVTFHESTHRYDKSTHGGTIGEVNAIIRTAIECPAWNYASDNYIQSQASYAAKSLSQYSYNNIIPQDIFQKLNTAFTGYVTFEIVNNQLTVNNNLKECIVVG